MSFLFIASDIFLKCDHIVIKIYRLGVYSNKILCHAIHFFSIFFQNFLSPKAKIFVREILKGMLKLGSLFVSEDSELIQAIISFSIFRTKSSTLAHSGGHTINPFSKFFSI